MTIGKNEIHLFAGAFLLLVDDGVVELAVGQDGSEEESEVWRLGAESWLQEGARQDPDASLAALLEREALDRAKTEALNSKAAIEDDGSF